MLVVVVVLLLWYCWCCWYCPNAVGPLLLVVERYGPGDRLVVAVLLAAYACWFYISGSNNGAPIVDLSLPRSGTHETIIFTPPSLRLPPPPSCAHVRSSPRTVALPMD